MYPAALAPYFFKIAELPHRTCTCTQTPTRTQICTRAS